MKTACRAVLKSYLLKFMIFLSGVLITRSAPAQVNHDARLSPNLLLELKNKNNAGKLELVVTISHGEKSNETLRSNYKAQKIFESAAFNVYKIAATIIELDSVILKMPGIIFIEKGNRIPVEELQVSNLDLSVNKINLAHRNFPAINGDGVVVSVKENKPDTTDIDFKGRFLSTYLSSTTVNSHASIMSTMIGGGGNSWHLGKGAAWGSTISSSSFATLLPDANSAYQQYNISVQNHSYGVGVENFYGSDAAAYDASAISNPYLLHVFSSGNSGTAAATTGTYAGLTGFANETGSFKMAKNILTVGATDSFSIVSALSSKGPAHDGRVKPELVAFGEDGSSGAAALVSGTALLLQHSHKRTYGSLPFNTLIKAILINSADDVGNPEIDYATGYGALNAINALKTMAQSNYILGSVSNGISETYPIQVPAGIKKMKLTLVWNDPPAQPNASKALINDLDLELTQVSSGQTWQPWVLNPYPHADSLLQLPKRSRDSLNNIEQITVDDPAAGNYLVKINGYNIPSATNQVYYVAYQFDSTDKFEWQFPTTNDFIFPSVSNVIRWKSSFAATNGNLEYSIDNGNSWHLIDNNTNLSSGYFRWNTTSAISKGLLRMTIGANQFVSDTFTIANRTTTGVGFNCPDSFLFYWKKLPGVNNYRIYQLGNKYLEPTITTTDSFVMLSKNANPSLYYAVAPIINNKEGVKSYTINYTTQGVECYIRSFLGLLVNNSVELTLTLGATYNVASLRIEKFNGNEYVLLQQVSNPTQLSYNFTDASLKKGLNVYRVTLMLNGGRVIYSVPVTIYYFAGTEFIVYPNPALQYYPITILSDNQFEPATLQVINMQGQKVYEMKLNDLTNVLPAGRLSKGLYILRIIRKDQKNVVLKVVVN
jgi:hypothetical protein